MPNSLSELHTLHAWEDNQITERCTQGEYAGKVLQFKLVDKDGAIDLTNCLVQYAVTRPDKTEDLLDCTVDNGVVKCNLTYSVTSVVGLVHGEVRVIGSNDSGIIKFYGVNLRVYKGVSDEAAEQSDEFTALVAALQKVVSITPNPDSENTYVVRLDDSIAQNGLNPVASGVIYDYLQGNYRQISFAHENNESSYDDGGVYIDDATDIKKMYYVRNSNEARVGILFCVQTPRYNYASQVKIDAYGNITTRAKTKESGEADYTWKSWTPVGTTRNIQDYAVTTPKLANGAVTSDKLDASVVTSGVIYDFVTALTALDSTITENGTKPVASGVIYDYLNGNFYTKANTYTKSEINTEVGDLKSALNGTVDLIGDTTIYSVSLAESGTGVGANWNFYYDKSLPKGTKLNFYLSAYTGVLFTDVLVRFYDTTNTLRSLAPSVMQTGKLQTYTLFEDCTRIWVQINRSAPENGVSAQFIMSFDTSGLSADVAKIQSVLPTNTQEVLKSNIQKYDGKRFKNDGVEEDTASGWITSDYLPVGLGITATGYSYSSTRPGIVEYNASKQTLGVVAGNGEYVTRTYTPPTKVAYVRLQTLASKQDTKATSIINSEPKVYRVEKDGSGDFTKLSDAINEAVRYMDSTVYVGRGTWNIIDELGVGTDYIVSSDNRGLVLKNRVRVICASDSKITCNYTGSDSDTITWLSAFNAGPLGFTLENATIESSNCRYAIHDERDQDADEYNNYYINCKIKHDNTNGGYNQCIGGGLGLNGHVIIDGCIFENPARTNYQIVYYHNSAGSGKSFVEVKGSYFKGTNTLGFQWYGSSPATQKSTLFAHGNSLGSAIQHTGASGATVENTEVVSFNNEIRP